MPKVASAACVFQENNQKVDESLNTHILAAGREGGRETGWLSPSEKRVSLICH